MKTFLLVCVLVAVSSAARLPSARQQQAPGYNYPKPEEPSSGYHYPKPDQGLPDGEQPPSVPTTEVPADVTTEAEDTAPEDVEAVAEAEGRGDQFRQAPLKIQVLPQKLVQPVEYQQVVYYPISARLQAAPIVQEPQYSLVPAPSGFAYSTQVFQQW